MYSDKGEKVTIKARLMLVMGYLGAVVGAGFASGQEIMQFFVNFGIYGFTGSMMATSLFALLGGLLLYTTHKYKVYNYQDLLGCLLGRRMGKTIDSMIALFLFLGISTMLSASGAVFSEHLYLSKYCGVFLAYVLIMVFLATGKNGLIFSYNLLVPIKLVFLLLITGYAAIIMEVDKVDRLTTYTASSDAILWPVAALLYVAYNFALAMVVLTEYTSVSNPRHGIMGAMWGGLVLGVLVILSYLSLSKYLPQIAQYQVPMLYITGRISIEVKAIYSLVLWVGILTTAFANAYGFAQRLARLTGLKYQACLFASVTLALPLATQSFSSLVGKIYPLFGLLGLVIVGALITKPTKDMLIQLYYNIGSHSHPRR
ncbi:MAG: hypothetical protein ACOX0E_04450 [Syntrophomonadaceae bacterium]